MPNISKLDIDEKYFADVTRKAIEYRKNGGVIKCANCSETLPPTINIVDHVRDHISKTPYQCPICKANFSRLKDHFKEKHPTDDVPSSPKMFPEISNQLLGALPHCFPEFLGVVSSSGLLPVPKPPVKPSKHKTDGPSKTPLWKAAKSKFPNTLHKPEERGQELKAGSSASRNFQVSSGTRHPPKSHSTKDCEPGVFGMVSRKSASAANTDRPLQSNEGNQKLKDYSKPGPSGITLSQNPFLHNTTEIAQKRNVEVTHPLTRKPEEKSGVSASRIPINQKPAVSVPKSSESKHWKPKPFDPLHSEKQIHRRKPSKGPPPNNNRSNEQTDSLDSKSSMVKSSDRKRGIKDLQPPKNYVANSQEVSRRDSQEKISQDKKVVADSEGLDNLEGSKIKRARKSIAPMSNNGSRVVSNLSKKFSLEDEPRAFLPPSSVSLNYLRSGHPTEFPHLISKPMEPKSPSAESKIPTNHSAPTAEFTNSTPPGDSKIKDSSLVPSETKEWRNLGLKNTVPDALATGELSSNKKTSNPRNIPHEAIIMPTVSAVQTGTPSLPSDPVAAKLPTTSTWKQNPDPKVPAIAKPDSSESPVSNVTSAQQNQPSDKKKRKKSLKPKMIGLGGTKLSPELRYKFLSAFIGFEVNRMVKEREVVSCGKPQCDFTIMGASVSQSVQRHLLSHIHSKPFICPICREEGSQVERFGNIEGHLRSKHPDLKSFKDEKGLIHKDLVPEATENLFECFSELNWVRDVPDDLLAEGPLRFRKTTQGLNTTNSSGGTHSTPDLTPGTSFSFPPPTPPIVPHTNHIDENCENVNEEEGDPSPAKGLDERFEEVFKAVIRRNSPQVEVPSTSNPQISGFSSTKENPEQNKISVQKLKAADQKQPDILKEKSGSSHTSYQTPAEIAADQISGNSGQGRFEIKKYEDKLAGMKSFNAEMDSRVMKKSALEQKNPKNQEGSNQAPTSRANDIPSLLGPNLSSRGTNDEEEFKGKNFPKKLGESVKRALEIIRLKSELSCGMCRKSFSPQSGLSSIIQNHFLLHIPEKALKCTICGYNGTKVDTHIRLKHKKLASSDPYELAPAFENQVLRIMRACFPSSENSNSRTNAPLPAVSAGSEPKIFIRNSEQKNEELKREKSALYQSGHVDKPADCVEQNSDFSRRNPKRKRENETDSEDSDEEDFDGSFESEYSASFEEEEEDMGEDYAEPSSTATREPDSLEIRMDPLPKKEGPRPVKVERVNPLIADLRKQPLPVNRRINFEEMDEDSGEGELSGEECGSFSFDGSYDQGQVESGEDSELEESTTEGGKCAEEGAAILPPHEVSENFSEVAASEDDAGGNGSEGSEGDAESDEEEESRSNTNQDNLDESESNYSFQSGGVAEQDDTEGLERSQLDGSDSEQDETEEMSGNGSQEQIPPGSPSNEGSSGESEIDDEDLAESEEERGDGDGRSGDSEEETSEGDRSQGESYSEESDQDSDDPHD